MPTFNISDEDREIIIRAIEAARHPPKLVDGLWWIWDFDSRIYVRTDYVGAGAGRGSIGDAEDVDVADVQDGDTLVYNGDTGMFENRPSTYVHNQNTASAEWKIVHGMGKYPAVAVIDSAGTVVYGDITYNDQDTVTLTFAAAFSGKATLN